MTTRYQLFETLIIWYQIVIKLFTTNYLVSPWAQVLKTKFDFKITYQVNTNFPVGMSQDKKFEDSCLDIPSSRSYRLYGY
jgi:hypothetical protein